MAYYFRALSGVRHEPDLESSATQRGLGDDDGRVVCGGDLTHDREAETGAAGVSVAGLS